MDGTSPSLRLDPAGIRAAIAWNGTHYAIIRRPRDWRGCCSVPRVFFATGGDPPRYAQSNRSAGDSPSPRMETGSCWREKRSIVMFLLLRHSRLKGNEAGCRPATPRRRTRSLSTANTAISRERCGTGPSTSWPGSKLSPAIHTRASRLSAGSPATIARHAYEHPAPALRRCPTAPSSSWSLPGCRRVQRDARARSCAPTAAIARSFDVDSSAVTGRPLLTALPDGVAYVASSVQDAAPHHGTSHVMMAIARSSVTPPPYPPHVSCAPERRGHPGRLERIGGNAERLPARVSSGRRLMERARGVVPPKLASQNDPAVVRNEFRDPHARVQRRRSQRLLGDGVDEADRRRAGAR